MDIQKPSNDQELIAALVTLAPLQKTHHSWPFTADLIAKTSLLEQVVRINKSGSSYLNWDNRAHLASLFPTMKKMGVSELCMSMSPWYTNFPSTDPTVWDQTATSEIAWQAARFSATAQNIRDLNTQFSSNVQVSVIWLDQEKFYVQAGNDSWNKALAAKNTITYTLAKSAFPNAKIVQYGRGAPIRQDISSDAPNGFKEVYYEGSEPQEYVNPSLYCTPEITSMRQAFMDTARWTDSYHPQFSRKIIPNISLGGFVQRTNNENNAGWQWANYRYSYSYSMGAEVNNSWFWDPIRVAKYAEYSRAPFAMLWPTMFDPNAAQFGLHYLAYVMGAQNLKGDWLWTLGSWKDEAPLLSVSHQGDGIYPR